MGRKERDEHKPPLTIIHDELVRQRESLARRSDAMNGRATVLVGSAAIAGSLQASSLFGNGWLTLGLCCILFFFFDSFYDLGCAEQGPKRGVELGIPPR